MARLARSGAAEVEWRAALDVVASLAEPDQRLREALERFSEAEVTAVLDEAIAALSVDAVADLVVLPALRMGGGRWKCGEATDPAARAAGAEPLPDDPVGAAERLGGGAIPVAR